MGTISGLVIRDFQVMPNDPPPTGARYRIGKRGKAGKVCWWTGSGWGSHYFQAKIYPTKAAVLNIAAVAPGYGVFIDPVRLK